MPEEYQIAIISAGSALLGSVIGGIISFITTRDASSRQWRQSLVIREIERKETLYSEFLGECAQLLLSAIDKKVSKGAAFITLYSLLGKMRMTSSEEVVTAAEDLAKHSTNAHAGECNEKEETGDTSFQSRNRFTVAVRKELESIKQKT